MFAITLVDLYVVVNCAIKYVDTFLEHGHAVFILPVYSYVYTYGRKQSILSITDAHMYFKMFKLR